MFKKIFLLVLAFGASAKDDFSITVGGGLISQKINGGNSQPDSIGNEDGRSYRASRREEDAFAPDTRLGGRSQGIGFGQQNRSHESFVSPRPASFSKRDRKFFKDNAIALVGFVDLTYKFYEIRPNFNLQTGGLAQLGLGSGFHSLIGLHFGLNYADFAASILGTFLCYNGYNIFVENITVISSFGIGLKLDYCFGDFKISAFGVYNIWNPELLKTYSNDGYWSAGVMFSVKI